MEASVVGMSISYLNPDTLYDMVCVLCVSVLSAIAGLWYGYWIGIKGRRAVNLSGASASRHCRSLHDATLKYP